LKGAHRPGYAALLASVQRGELDRIVAYGLSRLWRSRTERAEAIGVLSAARVGVALVRGSDLDLTSAAGRMYAGVLGEFDTAESEIKAERVARAAQQRAEEGRPNGALGYGWHRVHERDNAGRLTASRDVEDPAEAEVVRSIVADLLAGTSIKAVTASLNLRDLPRPTGQAAAWGPSTVRKLALRPSNVADRVHRGVVIGRGNWPALVDRADHDRVVALLNDPSRRLSRDGARRNLLSYASAVAACAARGFGSPAGRDTRCTTATHRRGELDRECRPRAHRRAQRAGRPHAQLRHHRPGRHVRRPVTSAPHTRSRSSTVYASRAHAVVSSSARPRPHAAQASAQPISTSPVQSATRGEGLEVAIRRFLYLQ